MAKFDRETQADALAIHLTGAASDGGAQTDPDDSLGGFRSSTRVGDQGFIVSNPMPQLRVVEAYGAPGVGTAEAISTGSLAYTPPSGSQGLTVSIADGETKILPGAEAGDYLVVERTTATSFSGTMTVELIDTLEQVLTNLTTAQHASGGTRYVGLMLRARQGIQNLKLWFGTAGDFEIGTEAPKADGSIQTIPARDVQPGGVTFSAPTTEGGAITISSIAADSNYGLWIAHSYAADADTSAATTFDLRMQYSTPLA